VVVSAAVISVVAGVFVRDRHLLLVRKRHTQRFMFPGGKLATGEDDIAALTREVQEEIGCAIAPDSFDFWGQVTVAAANEADTLITASVYQGALVGEPLPQNEIEEIFWQAIAAPIHQSVAPLVTEFVWPRLLQQV